MRKSTLIRQLDRYIGIIIIYIIGIFKTKKAFPSEIKKIAILRTTSIGDTVLISAIIQDLKIKYKNAKIDMFVGNDNISISNLIPNVNKSILIFLDKPLKSISIIFKSGEYDLLIDTGQWPRIDALFASFFRAKFKIGFKTPNQYRHYIYDKCAIHNNQIHEIENFRNLARIINVETLQEPIINLTESEKVDLIINNSSSRKIIFHAWPAGIFSELKEWSLLNWKQLADKLNDNNTTFYITGGKSDTTKANELEKILDLGDKTINLSGKLSLHETINLLNSVDLLISVNTGIMHIGGILNKNVIGLHGPTNHLRWGPLGENSISITPKNDQCEYLNLGYEYNLHSVDCMGLISIDEVYKTALKLLNR